MYNTEHYTALMTRLSNEKDYLKRAVGEESIAIRKAWIEQIEREIAAEILFLESKGISVYTSSYHNLSDDDLLKELGL